MTRQEDEERSVGLQTDAEAVVEMVELLAHRRSREESRRHPRYPTAESLTGHYAPETPFGWILCSATNRGGANGRCPTPQVPSSLHQTGADTLEVISGFHVVDFSQEGLQIQYECANPLKHSKMRLYLKVSGTTIPISMQWFNGNNGTARAGVSFAESIGTSPGLAGILVELSDRLVGHLIRTYLVGDGLHTRSVAVFAFLCILTNLKLRYIQAMSMVNQVYAALERFLGSNFVKRDSAIRLKTLLLGAVRQLRGPGYAADPDYRESFMALVMEHYREYGCSISGKEGRVVFLEKEFWEVMSTSLFFEELIASPHTDVVAQFRPLQAHFNTLVEFEPTLFGNEAFSNQFIHYSRAVSSVMDSREALIDVLSNLGNRLSAIRDSQSAERGSPSGRPATVTGMGDREEGSPQVTTAA